MKNNYHLNFFFKNLPISQQNLKPDKNPKPNWLKPEPDSQNRQKPDPIPNPTVQNPNPPDPDYLKPGASLLTAGQKILKSPGRKNS